MTYDEWVAEVEQRVDDAGLQRGSVPLTVGMYRAACAKRGLLPRTPSGDVDNCAAAAGGSAADCRVCSGRCPDAVRLFQRAAGVTAVSADRVSASLARTPSDGDGGVSARHSSDTAEHLTPHAVVGMVVRAIGRVDLDPASCALANDYVEADAYYDRVSDGLKHPWSGTVFLNPPGGLCDGDGRPVYPRTKRREGCSATGACGLPPGHVHHGVVSSAAHWWRRLAREWASGRVEAAVFLGFSLELQCSSQADPPAGLLLPLDCALCVPDRRLRFLVEGPDGGLVPGDNPPHASFLAYLGPRPAEFAAAFEGLGRVLLGHHLAASSDPDRAAVMLAATPEELAEAYAAAARRGSTC